MKRKLIPNAFTGFLIENDYVHILDIVFTGELWIKMKNDFFYYEYLSLFFTWSLSDIFIE